MSLVQEGRAQGRHVMTDGSWTCKCAAETCAAGQRSLMLRQHIGPPLSTHFRPSQQSKSFPHEEPSSQRCHDPGLGLHSSG